MSQKTVSKIPIYSPSKNKDPELLSYYSCKEVARLINANYDHGKDYLDVCKAHENISERFLKVIGENADYFMTNLYIDSFEALINLGMPLPDGITEEDFYVLRQFKENASKAVVTLTNETCQSIIGVLASTILFEHPRYVVKFLKTLPLGYSVADALNYTTVVGDSGGVDGSGDVVSALSSVNSAPAPSASSADSSASHPSSASASASAPTSHSLPSVTSSTPSTIKTTTTTPTPTLIPATPLPASVLKKRPPLYYHFSAHDSTLVEIGGCFGLDHPGLYPHYGGTLIVETYADVNRTVDGLLEGPSFSIRFLHDYDPPHKGPLNLTELVPHHCHGVSPCPLRAFRANFSEVARDISAGNLSHRFCAPVSIWGYYRNLLGKAVSFALRKYPIFLPGGAAVCVLFLIWLAFSCCRQRQNDNESGKIRGDIDAIMEKQMMKEHQKRQKEEEMEEREREKRKKEREKERERESMGKKSNLQTPTEAQKKKKRFSPKKSQTTKNE